LDRDCKADGATQVDRAAESHTDPGAHMTSSDIGILLGLASIMLAMMSFGFSVVIALVLLMLSESRQGRRDGAWPRDAERDRTARAELHAVVEALSEAEVAVALSVIEQHRTGSHG
jgi:hypothetical protein